MAETFTTGLGICPVLETGQEIIGKTEQVRFAPTVPADPPLQPKVQDVMEGDMRKEGGENRALRRSDLCGLDQSLFHDARLENPENTAKGPGGSEQMPQNVER